MKHPISVSRLPAAVALTAWLIGGGCATSMNELSDHGLPLGEGDGLVIGSALIRPMEMESPGTTPRIGAFEPSTRTFLVPTRTLKLTLDVA